MVDSGKIAYSQNTADTCTALRLFAEKYVERNREVFTV